jgi:hypothetical protein
MAGRSQKYIQIRNPFVMNKYLYIQNRNPFAINKSVIYKVPISHLRNLEPLKSIYRAATPLP